MATKTILKDDGIYIYDDYKLGRAAMRIKELTSANPAQNIRRHSELSSPVEAVLAKASQIETWLSGYSAVGAPSFKQIYHPVSDDYVGSNLSKMIDRIQGRAQTKSLVKTIADEGLSGSGFATYEVSASAEYFQDQSPIIPFEESAKKAGDVVAYVMHPAMYAALSAAPVATVYAGVGDGTLDSSLLLAAVAETITITALDPTNFSVVGSVSGAMGTAVAGTVFSNGQIEILITPGAIPFVAGDAWTVNSVAAPL